MVQIVVSSGGWRIRRLSWRGWLWFEGAGHSQESNPACWWASRDKAQEFRSLEEAMMSFKPKRDVVVATWFR